MGITDFRRVYSEDLAPGDDIIFARPASQGVVAEGVRFIGDAAHELLITSRRHASGHRHDSVEQKRGQGTILNAQDPSPYGRQLHRLTGFTL